MTARAIALGVVLMAAAATIVVALQGLGAVQLTLVARDGARTVLGPLPADAFSPRVSPDGRQVSFESGGVVWLAGIDTLASRRRFAPIARSNFAVWGPDSGHLVFIGIANGPPSLYSAAISGTAAPDLLAVPARAPDGWSIANSGVSFITLDGDDYDIWFYSAKTKQVTPLVVMKGSRQLSSQLSPDGRWLAYKSDETGEFEVWVQPFPSGPRTRVTSAGGNNPRWSADGRELFYDTNSEILSVAVSGSATLTFGAPRAFPITGFVQAGSLRRHWDLMPDGRLLVMVR
jgi:eukaryotic-like serine/threonine-protein kinase